MLRAFAKAGAAYAFQKIGMDRWRSTFRAVRDTPVVLGYHRVVERFIPDRKRSIPAMFISSQMLESHLDWIGCRYQFISLDQLGGALESGAKFAKPAAAITFDDGYRDVYDHAFPILKRKGIPAAVFVVTDFTDHSQPLLHDRLYRALSACFPQWTAPQRELPGLLRAVGIPVSQIRLNGAAKNPLAAAQAFLRALSQKDVLRATEALEQKIGLEKDPVAEPEPLTWEMLREMQRHGITVGSHTRTHAVLTNEHGQKLHEELAISRHELETRLGVSIRHFAYPDGRFNAETIQAVAAAGYRYAYTTCRHQNLDDPCLTIPRRVLWEKSCVDPQGRFSPAILSCLLNGLFDLAAACPQDHRVRVSGRRRFANILSAETTL